MKNKLIPALGLIFMLTIACRDEFVLNDFNEGDSDLNFPQNITFKQNLSAYAIFQDEQADLIPTKDFHLLELSSPLFTDYAHKQRLVKVPEGAQMKKQDNGSINFPDGTQLVKTFFYYKDERNPDLGKIILESRLLIKAQGNWNMATYIWNEYQTDAYLELEGLDTQISWVNANGNRYSTLYHIPKQTECFTCHQSKATLAPLGPTLMNLNRNVVRNEISVNQLNHLQSVKLLNDFDLNEVSEMVDYKNVEASIPDRARAYLAMNCAHCHNPDGWRRARQRRFDFRYEIPLTQTGIPSNPDKISRTLSNGRMPYIGTTMLDKEGIDLINDFIEKLQE